MGKKIAIKGKESQTGYLDDMQPAHEEAKDILVRKSVLIPKSLADKIEDRVYHERIGGKINYSQKQVFVTALKEFFEKHK